MNILTYLVQSKYTLKYAELILVLKCIYFVVMTFYDFKVVVIKTDVDKMNALHAVGSTRVGFPWFYQVYIRILSLLYKTFI